MKSTIPVIFFFLLFAIACSEDAPEAEVPRTNEGSHIVYEEHTALGGAQIVIMSPDGTDSKVITPSTSASESVPQDIGPKLSLDRKMIVYASNRGQTLNGYDLMTANADGSDFRNITNTPDRRENSPDISINGKIVFAAQDNAGVIQLFTRKIDGSDEQQLTFFSGTPSNTFADVPSWSEKGDKVIFVGLTADNPQYNIYKIDADGKNLVNLTNSRTTGSSQGSLSPDGKTIVFARRDQSKDQELFTMNADGTGVNQLTDFSNSNVSFLASGDPCWSPDGKKIAFTSNKDKSANNQGYDIYVMDRDGGNIVRITNSTTIKFYPD